MMIEDVEYKDLVIKVETKKGKYGEFYKGHVYLDEYVLLTCNSKTTIMLDIKCKRWIDHFEDDILFAIAELNRGDYRAVDELKRVVKGFDVNSLVQDKIQDAKLRQRRKDRKSIERDLNCVTTIHRLEARNNGGKDDWR